MFEHMQATTQIIHWWVLIQLASREHRTEGQENSWKKYLSCRSACCWESPRSLLVKGPHVPVRSQSLLVVCQLYILKADNPIQYTIVYTMVCVSLWVCNFSTNPSRDGAWVQHSPNSTSLTSWRLWLPKFPKDIRDTVFAHVNLLFYSEAQHSWPHRPKRQSPRRCKCLGGFSQAIEYLPLGGCWCVKAELATKNKFGKLAPKMLGRLLPM